MTPAPKVLALDQWIKAYAAEHGHVYADYHTAMKDNRDGLPATLSHDGVHPLPAGYGEVNRCGGGSRRRWTSVGTDQFLPLLCGESLAPHWVRLLCQRNTLH